METVGILVESLKNGGAERAAANLSHDLSEKYQVVVIVFDGTNIAIHIMENWLIWNSDQVIIFCKEYLTEYLQ